MSTSRKLHLPQMYTVKEMSNARTAHKCMHRIRLKVQYLVLCRPGSGRSAISVGTQLPTNVPHLLCLRRLATACMLTAALSKLRLHRNCGGALHVR